MHRHSHLQSQLCPASPPLYLPILPQKPWAHRRVMSLEVCFLLSKGTLAFRQSLSFSTWTQNSRGVAGTAPAPQLNLPLLPSLPGLSPPPLPSLCSPLPRLGHRADRSQPRSHISLFLVTGPVTLPPIQRPGHTWHNAATSTSTESEKTLQSAQQPHSALPCLHRANEASERGRMEK